MKQGVSLQVIKDAIAGDQDAFNLLIDAKSKDIYYIAAGLMRNRQDGEDAAQEAVIRIHKKISRLQSAEAFNSWAYRVVFSTCMDMKRKGKHMSTDPVEKAEIANVYEERNEFLPSNYLADEEKKTQLLTAIETLPDKQRACLLLYYYEEMTCAEVAATLGMGVQVVKNNLNRARKKLRATMENEEAYRPSSGGSSAMAGAVPILTQILQEDAGRSFSPKIAEKLAAAAQKASVPPSVPHPGTGLASLAQHKVALTLAGIAVVATVSVGSYLAFDRPTQATPPASVPLGSSPTHSIGWPAGQAPPVEEGTGDVLESATPPTIPSNPSSSRSSGGSVQKEPDKAEQPEETGAPQEDELLFVSRISGSDFTYSLFFTETRDPTLATIVYRDAAGSTEEVSREGLTREQLPRGPQLIDAFSSWK